jgi:hypothetical protein
MQPIQIINKEGDFATGARSIQGSKIRPANAPRNAAGVEKESAMLSHQALHEELIQHLRNQAKSRSSSAYFTNTKSLAAAPSPAEKRW